jgi:hypothetical protein
VRLGAGLLIALGLAGAAPLPGQTAKALPWEKLPRAPWESRFDPEPDSPPPPTAAQARVAFRVRITDDGALTVLDGRGVIRLKTGLPGRPRALWRGGGQPLPGPWAAIPYGPAPEGPALSAAFWNAPDPRMAMAGLLWILDDGERTLTLVHPATGRVAFLPLPEPEGVELRFLPGGLEALERLPEGSEAPRRSRRWVLPWMALLPSLLRLEAQGGTQPRGTALQPFPKEAGW